jgi:gas vesicle protein
MATKKEQEAIVDNSSKIDVIRNLIFGENIEQYNSEFELLKKDILNKRKELHTLIEETSSELNAAIDNLSTDLNIRITDLESKVEEQMEDMDAKKLDRDMLSDALRKLADNIRS